MSVHKLHDFIMFDCKYVHSSSPCLFTDCLEPNITNAIIEAPRGTTYGEVVLVYCDEGYSLNGPSLITCRDGPQWSDLPTCVIKSNAFKYVYALFY